MKAQIEMVIDKIRPLYYFFFPENKIIFHWLTGDKRVGMKVLVHVVSL